MTQRPPPQIVACGFPARRSSAHDAQRGIRLKVHRGHGQLRPCQGHAVWERLKRFPVYCAVLTAPTAGLPPALLGAAGESPETVDVARETVGVVVAAPRLMEGLRLRWDGRMEHGAAEPLDGLCRSREARARGPALDRAVAWPMACAVGRAAHEAHGLWPWLPWRGRVSLGQAPTRAATGLGGGACPPALVAPLFPPRRDAERRGAGGNPADPIVQRAPPVGCARQGVSSRLGTPHGPSSMPGERTAEHPDTAPWGWTVLDVLPRASWPHASGWEPPAPTRP